jgi:D-alanine-D-alanine ligase
MSAQKLRVAVLRGGPSPEYDISLKTGENLLSILRQNEDSFEPVDVFIDRSGIWHYRGLPTESMLALKHVDVAWNAMHGAYGEDGQIQKLLNSCMVPYIGPEALPAAMSHHKDRTKNVYRMHGILTPEYRVLDREQDYETELVNIFRNFMHPVVVKPSNAGSSIGTVIAHTWEELMSAVSSAFAHSNKVLVEEFIRGKEASCGIIDNFRGEKLYALIPVEVVKSSTSYIYNFEMKCDPSTKKQCPGSLSIEENKLVESAARAAHEALGLRHYSSSDFIITPSGKVYILETDSLPGFTKESVFPNSLAATGIKENDFVSHIISQVR